MAQAAQAIKRISDSFRDHDTLSDADLSEDYDDDDYFISFDDAQRVKHVVSSSAEVVKAEEKKIGGADEIGIVPAIEEEFNFHKKSADEVEVNLAKKEEVDDEAEVEEAKIDVMEGGDQFDGDDDDEEKLLQKQALMEAGLQESVSFQVNFVTDRNSHAASLAAFIEHEKTIDESLKLTREIDAYNEHARQTMGNQFGYKDYFNYGLNTTTWRMLVNKQILMRYERLFIEKQINEVASERRKLENTLKDLENQISDVRQQQKRVTEGGSGEPSRPHQGAHQNEYHGHHRGGHAPYKRRDNYGGGPGNNRNHQQAHGGFMMQNHGGFMQPNQLTHQGFNPMMNFMMAGGQPGVPLMPFFNPQPPQ